MNKFLRNLNGVKNPVSDTMHTDIIACVEKRLGSVLITEKVQLRQNLSHNGMVFLDDVTDQNVYAAAFKDAVTILKISKLTA